MPRNIFDEIGFWSEIKLDILREYGQAYSKILSKQKNPSLEHVYIDAFAGTGIHISRASGEFIPGSPINALNIQPPFKEYHFIDVNEVKVDVLQNLAKEKPEQIHFYEGDCNKILLKDVFPNILWKDYKRGLCLLDPYGLHLDWNVIETAGKMKSIEIFLNFPVLDMNRNVLWNDPSKVDSRDIGRMNRFWGDESWRKMVYSKQGNLFKEDDEIKKDINNLIRAFRKRLKEVAGFPHVPEPIPMKNEQGGTIYYLFFASPKPVAKEIVEDIFNKYRKQGL